MVHAEACTHLHRSLDNIQKLGAKSGVVLNPHTPADTIQHVLDVTDHVLIMTVNPGFGGQTYIPLVAKIEAVKQMIDTGGHDIDIEVDGGISVDNIARCTSAGANVFVAGTSVFGQKDRKKAIEALRDAAEKAA